jgi:hypothetical protein
VPMNLIRKILVDCDGRADPADLEHRRAAQ